MNADNEVTLHQSEISPRSKISNLFEFTSSLQFTSVQKFIEIQAGFLASDVFHMFAQSIKFF